MIEHRAHRTRLASLIAAIVVLAAPASTAVADKFVDEANLAAAATRGTSAAHEEIFPRVAALQQPPIPVGLSRDALHELLLLEPGDTQWANLARWATATPQVEALEALHTIADPDSIFIIGAPYGAEGIDQKFIDAGLYIDLGPDGLLFGSTFHYRERLSWLVALALFESARLADEGEGEQALSVLNDCFRLGRILAERAFAAEVADAFRIMSLACERMRDVVFTYEDAFDPTILRQASDRLDENDIKITKIPLPPGDRIAASQIVDRAFAERGKANPADLASLMSRAQVGDRPLRLFSAASWWDSLASNHPDWFDTTDKIAAVWSDYTLRWSIDDLNDSLLKRPSDFLKMDGAEFPVVYAAMKDIEALFNLRRHLLVEIGATDNGLGVFAFKIKQKRFPPQISSIDPGYINERARDLFFTDERYIDTVYKDFPYWVPIRDQTFGRREDPHPYEISVVLEVGGADQVAAGTLPPSLPFDASALIGDVSAIGEDFPADVFDPETFRVTDIQGLRDYLNDVLSETEFDGAEFAQEVTAGMPFPGGLANIPPDQLRQSIEESLRPQFDAMRPMLQSAQIDPDKAYDLMVRVTTAMAQDEEYAKLLDTIGRGASIGDSEIRRAMNSLVDSLVTDEFVNEGLELVKPLIDSMGGLDAVLPGLAAGPPPAFSTSLDDSVFLLYSVGTNGTDDRAKVVGLPGVGADDILFWPPIIALERRSNR